LKSFQGGTWSYSLPTNASTETTQLLVHAALQTTNSGLSTLSDNTNTGLSNIISNTNTTNSELSTLIDNTNTTNSGLSTLIGNTNTTNSELSTIINNINNLNSDLSAIVDNTNTTNSELSTIIDNINNLNSDLSAIVDNTNTTNSELVEANNSLITTIIGQTQSFSSGITPHLITNQPGVATILSFSPSIQIIVSFKNFNLFINSFTPAGQATDIGAYLWKLTLNNTDLSAGYANQTNLMIAIPTRFSMAPSDILSLSLTSLSQSGTFANTANVYASFTYLQQ
jgi:uncharacterized protein YfcZ (UPF0381/DUF406 family)